MKLGIGTVQFGLNYGVTNINGKVHKEEVSNILSLSANNGIRILDTASAYGDSEMVLGEALPNNHSFSIVSKIPSFGKNKIADIDINQLESIFKKSLSDLKQDSIYGLLIHNTNDLFVENGHLLLEKMLEFKKNNLVKKIGISVYSPEQINKVLEQHNIDLVQVPINIFDQRFLSNNYLKNLKKNGIEVHARSIFLQGLLAQPYQSRPCHESLKKHLNAFYQDCVKLNLNPLKVALSFVLQKNEIDTALVGVTSSNELKEILHATDISLTEIDFQKYAINDENIINPTLWPKN